MKNFTRQDAETYLIDILGIEAPNKAQVSALLNFRKEYVDDAINETTSSVESKIRDEYKDYVNPTDHQKIVEELNGLRDSSSKAIRVAKYSKILPKYHDFVDAQLKDADNFDEALEQFISEHQELCVVEKPKEEALPTQTPTPVTTTSKVTFEDMKQTSQEKQVPTTLAEAIAQAYETSAN